MTAYTPPDLQGRTAVVTGANKGIGLWTAAGFAKAGARVVLVCRNRERGEAARAFIAGRSGQTPDLLLADFASLRAVDDLGVQLNERYPSLHILVNNAGLFSPRRLLSQDGYELTFAVNHLASFLLTNRVLPALERAGREGRARARIVTVSSMASRGASINFEDLMASRRYNMGGGAYGSSKLANILFTKELTRRLTGRPVTANCLHPGVVATEIANKGGIASLVWSLMKPFMLSQAEGAVNSLYVATAPEIEGVSGEFFVKQNPAAPNPIADDLAVAARLWTESEWLIERALRRL